MNIYIIYFLVLLLISEIKGNGRPYQCSVVCILWTFFLFLELLVVLRQPSTLFSLIAQSCGVSSNYKRREREESKELSVKNMVVSCLEAVRTI